MTIYICCPLQSDCLGKIALGKSSRSWQISFRRLALCRVTDAWVHFYEIVWGEDPWILTLASLSQKTDVRISSSPFSVFVREMPIQWRAASLTFNSYHSTHAAWCAWLFLQTSPKRLGLLDRCRKSLLYYKQQENHSECFRQPRLRQRLDMEKESGGRFPSRNESQIEG